MTRPLRWTTRFLCGPALLWLSPLLSTPSVVAQTTSDRPWLRDRGAGVATSQFGTYVRRGELLVYPFVEWYADRNYEYKPSEVGYPGDTDYRGQYSATEGLIFLGYGLGENLAVEFEASWIGAELERAPEDGSGVPEEIEESGLGDVEAQLRWRFQQEAAGRPELFTYFETVFPFQKSKQLIGTPGWEFKLGAGLIRGWGFGTMTFRAGVEYSEVENKVEAGEYAIEYLRRLSERFRVFAMIEGNQLDEVSLITEVQWFLAPRVFLKVNNGWGLTPNATDFAPELGLMFTF